jgi:modulator of FtsH protease
MEAVAAEWSDLFVAAAGASAALAGLVFVSVSINLRPIVDTPGLPDRAMMTLLLLLGVLIISLFGLIPGQSAESLGTELLIQSAVWTAAIAWLAVKSLPARPFPAGWFAVRLMPPMFGTIPYLVGSILLISGDAAGLNWVLAGMIGALLAAVMNAWVLLVEILR